MSEDNSSFHRPTTSDEAVTPTASPAFESVNIVIKIEKCDDDDDENEAIFEPQIDMTVGRALVSPKVEPKCEPAHVVECAPALVEQCKPALVEQCAPQHVEKEEDTSSKLPQPNPPRPKPSTRIEKDGIFTCLVCNRVFQRGSSLALHMKCHDVTHPQSFECHDCHRSFRYKINLVRHLSGPCTLQQPVPCPECDRKFETNSRMQSHFNSHHNDQPHSCDFCGKRFGNYLAVERHRKRHIPGGMPRRYACSVCDKSFPLLNALECHMRTHTKERPFQCAVCVRAFSHKHNMLRHMQRHDKVLHLQCEVCHKVFPRESRLKYHMRVHMSNKKPYECGECPKTYSHQQNITRHYRKKHPHVEYIPPITDAEFANKAWEMRLAQGKNGDVDLQNPGYIIPELKLPELKRTRSEPKKASRSPESQDSDEQGIAQPELVILGDI